METMNSDDLRNWMERNGRTAEYVAAMANVSVRTVSRFLEGESLRPAMLNAIAAVIRSQPKSKKIS